MRWIVGIRTRNRANLLDRTLAQMRRLVLPAGVQWQLLVVNDGSTDHTDEIIARHARRLPIRRIVRSRTGASIAETLESEWAAADWMVWTDDDVLAPRNWLAEYVRAAVELPHASFFGGAIEPWFEVPPPRWLTSAWSCVRSAYATRLPGGNRFPVSRQLLPHRANLAIRSDVLPQFSSTLEGVGGADGRRPQEAEFVLELLDAGHRGYWIPAAGVRRFIPEERLTLDYLDQFFFAAGQRDALSGRSALVAPRKKLRRVNLRIQAILNWMKYRVSRGLVGPGAWIRYLTKSSYYRGLLAARPSRPVRTIRVGAA